MKKFTVFLAILVAVVSVSTAQVQKRVSMSTMPNYNVGTGLSNTLVQNGTNTSVLSSNLPLVNKLSSGTGVPVMPDYLTVAELEEVFFDAAQDTSDSGFQLRNAVPTENTFIWPIINSIPSQVGNASNGLDDVFGFAQFFKQTQGKFTIDSIWLRPFQFPNGGVLVTPIKSPLILIGFAVKTNLQTAQGGRFMFDNPQLRQLGNSEITISPDVINSRTIVDGNNRLTNILNTSIAVPKWEVEANESFGFVLYSENPKDSFNLFGTYMWDVKDSTQTLGYLLRHDVSGNDFFDKQAIYTRDFTNSPDLLEQFPSLHRRGVKANFFCIAFGVLDTPDGVETLTNEAKNFSLEPVAPNPVANVAKIQFSLQEPSTVSLRVVNSLGQVVQELASGAMTTGTYAADFDATNLPAGMYYYTLTAGTHSLTRSMVVVK